MKHASPLVDITAQMGTAMLSQALLVETWDGHNQMLLKQALQDRSNAQFKVALCYRKENEKELSELIHQNHLAGVRMSTDCLRLNGGFCETIAQADKMLVTHAETGIRALCKELNRLLRVLPHLRVYVPHLAWPAQDGNFDSDWPAAIRELAAMPSITIGVSAIQHFSRQPFPHDDIRQFALRVISQFPPTRIAMGSNYPLRGASLYRDHVGLAVDWITSIHAGWSFAI